jgi:hypothetical protein
MCLVIDASRSSDETTLLADPLYWPKGSLTHCQNTVHVKIKTAQILWSLTPAVSFGDAAPVIQNSHPFSQSNNFNLDSLAILNAVSYRHVVKNASSDLEIKIKIAHFLLSLENKVLFLQFEAATM